MHNRWIHLHEAIFSRPWAITAAGHAAVVQVFTAWQERKLALPKRADDDGDGPDFSDFVNAREDLSIDSNGIATISVAGVIGYKLAAIEKACGATDTGDVSDEIDQALAQGAKGILFCFDTPGGSVTGTPELAAKIGNIPVPTAAYIDSLCASAGYYLAVGCDVIVARPSADVGSLGVIIPMVDKSKLWDMAGVAPANIISTGSDLKGIGYGPSLSDAQRAYLQDEVDQSLADWKAHNAKFRTIDPSAMRGQTLSGSRALATNLIDRIGERAAAYNYLLKAAQP